MRDLLALRGPSHVVFDRQINNRTRCFTNITFMFFYSIWLPVRSPFEFSGATFSYLGAKQIFQKTTQHFNFFTSTCKSLPAGAPPSTPSIILPACFPHSTCQEFPRCDRAPHWGLRSNTSHQGRCYLFLASLSLVVFILYYLTGIHIICSIIRSETLFCKMYHL